MQILLVVLILCNSLSSDVNTNEKLEGWYFPAKEDRSFVNNLFHFYGNEFSMKSFGCETILFGKGIYEMKEDKLMLHFQKYEKPSNYQLMSRKSGHDKGKRIILEVYDNSNGEMKRLEGVTCIIENTSKGGFSNKNGRVELIIPSELERVNIHINYIGFPRITIPVINADSMLDQYEVYLSNEEYYLEDKTERFNINVISKRRFKLTYPNGYTTVFKKLSEEKSDGLKKLRY